LDSVGLVGMRSRMVGLPAGSQCGTLRLGRAAAYHPRLLEGTMDVVRVVSLMAATISMGLVAGVFGLYAHTIMPGLGRTDDRTFVGAFQAIDRAIINPWFLGGGFFGALVITIVAAITQLGRNGLPWVVAALVLYLVTFAITMAVNVPLNDGIKAAGDPDRITDLGAVRRRFNEARWTSWNLVRVVTSTTAFGLLAWALVLLGRST
jgi:uncharacterized membrane protein